MSHPLWNEDAKLKRRAIPVETEPVAFSVREKNFLFEPNEMRLFLDDGADGLKPYESEEQDIALKPQFDLADVKPAMVVLVVTRACPLRCRYCFAHPESAEGGAAVMSLDTARMALRLIPPGRDFTVGFFGGEPLLAKSLLRDVVREAKALAGARDIRARFTLTTNAILLDDETARFLDAEHFSVIVSLDGPPELHDAARPLANGNGSYSRVLTGLQILSNYQNLAKRVTLRATYDGSDSWNVEEERGEGDTRARLLERLVHLNDVARRYGFSNVSVEPADAAEGCGGIRSEEGGAVPVRPGPRWESEYLDAAAWFAEEKKQARNPLFHHLAVRLRRLESRVPAPSECGAGVGYVAVDPGGLVHACHRLGNSAIGDVARGIDTELQAPWRDNRYYARLRCPTCPWRNVCGGGCRLNSLHHGGDIRRPELLGCRLTETCIKAAAWVLAELQPSRRA